MIPVREWIGFLGLVVLTGCGGEKPIHGGTVGVLHSGSDFLSEIQVKVFRLEGGSTKAIGFGIPAANGDFELVLDGATGPLQLAPGEYCCTLESIGAPVEIPPLYGRPETTPLKITWPTNDRKLDLNISLAPPAR